MTCLLLWSFGCSTPESSVGRNPTNLADAESSEVGTDATLVAIDADNDVASDTPSVDTIVAQRCDGPTLQELGLTSVQPVYIVMEVIRVDTGKRLGYPIFRTSMNMPVSVDTETTQDGVTASFHAELSVKILADDRMTMNGQFVWKEAGKDAVVTPMAECISGFGPLSDVTFTLSNGVEIVTRTSFLRENP
jgi:hypothetical protein